MIDFLEDELLVCRRCGSKLLDKPRLRLNKYIYCFRCAKQAAKPIESKEYERRIQDKRTKENQNRELLVQYERDNEQWENERNAWVDAKMPKFRSFAVILAIAVLFLFSISPILVSIVIVAALPSWYIFLERRKQGLRDEYPINAPGYPLTTQLPEVELAEPEALDLLFQEREVSIKRTIPRPLILERDRFTCQSCGEPKDASQLEVHHIWMKKLEGPDCDANLIALCKFCHDHEYWFGHVRSHATTFRKN